jgi:hypothetical protein
MTGGVGRSLSGNRAGPESLPKSFAVPAKNKDLCGNESFFFF